MSSSGQVIGRLSVVGLPHTGPVPSLQIHSFSWSPVLFLDNDHAPGDWCAEGNWFYHLQSNVTVETILHLLFPMNWYRNRFVYCCGFHLVFHYDGEGLVLDDREWVVFTDIECGSLAILKNELLQLLPIVLRCLVGQAGGRGWCYGSRGAAKQRGGQTTILLRCGCDLVRASDCCRTQLEGSLLE